MRSQLGLGGGWKGVQLGNKFMVAGRRGRSSAADSNRHKEGELQAKGRGCSSAEDFRRREEGGAAVQIRIGGRTKGVQQCSQH